MKKCQYSHYNKVAMNDICDINCTACRGYRKVCKDKENMLATQVKV